MSENGFQWFYPVKIYINGVVETFFPLASTVFLAGASNWFRQRPNLNFKLGPCVDALMLAEQCWERNIAQSQPWISLVSWANSKRVWHLRLIIQIITSNRFFQFRSIAKLFPQNRNRPDNEEKFDWSQPILVNVDRLDCGTHFQAWGFLPDYLFSFKQRNHLGAKAGKSFSITFVTEAYWRGPPMAGLLIFSAVKKRLLILFLPKRKIVRHESKAPEKQYWRLHRKIPTNYDLYYPLGSKCYLIPFQKEDFLLRRK